MQIAGGGPAGVIMVYVLNFIVGGEGNKIGNKNKSFDFIKFMKIFSFLKCLNQILDILQARATMMD